VGRNCLDLIHPEDRNCSSMALKEVLAAPPGPCKWDARVRRKDGAYSWVESTVSNLLSEPEVQAIVVHQRDINARRSAEVETERLVEELRRSNFRLEEFAYTAAHDLRAPLRAISMQLDLLVRQTPIDVNTRHLVHCIVDRAARMSVLIDDLLSFASTGIHQPLEWFDLRSAVAQAMENLLPAIATGDATITVGPLPAVLSNKIHLVRVFQNLIANAVKYRRVDPAEIHVTAERRGQAWVVSVQDNGVGVAPKDQARLFTPFVRLANRDVPGTGLGLASCKKMIEELGGEIWVESEIGAGSTFYFTVAAADDERPV
jgi:light-regulated signal transduction histidine kinase (bacteriophytochrome)